MTFFIRSMITNKEKNNNVGNIFFFFRKNGIRQLVKILEKERKRNVTPQIHSFVSNE
jgi:hypothetical protein